MELIDRRALIDGFIASCNTGYESFPLDFIFEAIEQVPAIDAVPVVRCKDCKHCLIDLSERQYHICMKRPIFRHQVELNEYCSYGNRKAALNAEKGNEHDR